MPTTRPGFIWSGTEWVAIGQEAVLAPVSYQATAPSSPATGDIWIESDVDVPSIDSSQFLRWRKTMTGGETSLSGNDDSSLSLRYTPGYEQLYINGVLQVRGGDYTATTGTTVTGLTALVANDVVEIFSAVARTVADVYTQTQSDAKYYSKTSSASSGEASTININTKPWNMSWGVISHITNTTDLVVSGSTSNVTDIPNTSITFTAVPGRRYRFTCCISNITGTAGERGALSLTCTNATLGSKNYYVALSPLGTAGTYTYTFTATAGTATVKARAVRDVGSANMGVYADAGSGATLTFLEDIGPA